MKKLFKHCRKSQEGATAIEFAIVGPVLFFIVFGIIEFSIIMFVSSALETATNISARFGVTGSGYTDFPGDYNDDDGDGLPDDATREGFIRSEVEQRTFGLLDPTQIVIESQAYNTLSEVDRDEEPENLNAGSGGQVVLYKVSYEWPILTPLVNWVFEDGAMNLSSSVVVVNEGF